MKENHSVDEGQQQSVILGQDSFDHRSKTRTIAASVCTLRDHMLFSVALILQDKLALLY